VCCALAWILCTRVTHFFEHAARTCKRKKKWDLCFHAEEPRPIAALTETQRHFPDRRSTVPLCNTPAPPQRMCLPINFTTGTAVIPRAHKEKTNKVTRHDCTLKSVKDTIAGRP